MAVLTAGAKGGQATATGEKLPGSRDGRGHALAISWKPSTRQERFPAVTSARTQVSGTIQSLSADFNTQVKKGQVVARLDPSLLRKSIRPKPRSPGCRPMSSARVTLEDADKVEARERTWKAQLIPQTDLETRKRIAPRREASLKSAEAQVTRKASVNQNRVNLDHSESSWRRSTAS